MTDIQMRNRLRDLLKSPQGDWYENKLTRHNHFDAFAHIDVALNRVPVEFADEDRCRFMASCFWHFLTMHRQMKFSGGVIHRLLLRELYHNGPTDEMQFMLGNQSVRFSKVEFYLITGLRFGVIPDMTKYAKVENDIHQRYFPRADEVSLEEIRCVVTIAEFGETYDAVKLCLIYMLNWILMGVDERSRFQFGSFGWLRTSMRSTRSRRIFSFEVIPDLGQEFNTRRVTDLSPRILKWELTKQPRGKKLTKIFNARFCTNNIDMISGPMRRSVERYPCWSKRLRTRPQSTEHIFDPYKLLDADQLGAYKDFKKKINGELCDVDVLAPVDAKWFMHIQSNFMDLEDMR
ncbi:hypothetical protein Ddye_001060 [Dipteronia dyeriana]|uniref:DUF1985 domain-containing protein n=1 Tax=Dipteronia dyeriana TaxID=168575 RepID=A0AAE0CT56_9ROSI|nr:hypothetical protein Ddye_001060 [Dipteronia dyeriana]